MKKRTGISQDDRIGRVCPTHGIEAAESTREALLRRAIEVAGFLRYHDMQGLPDGHFDRLLSELKRILSDGNRPEHDGLMEPSQALLHTFIDNLHEILETFNRRWMALPGWYIDRVGGIPDLAPLPGTLWVALEKSTLDPVVINSGTGFLSGGTPCHPDEEVVLENPTVHKVVTVHYDRAGDQYPASGLGCVTSVEVREQHGRDLHHSRSPGFIVASPALLLREGERTVRLRLETESHEMMAFVDNARSQPGSPIAGWSDEKIARRLLSDIFHVEISVETGWKEIARIHTSIEEIHPDNLTIRCALPQGFPATTRCFEHTHGICSPHPALKVRLNPDAWLYPYSWIAGFMLKRIVIDTDVRGIGSLAIYNDLGRVDNSKPFRPFGPVVERGSWFVVGSSEMAAKRVSDFDLRIRWAQLPDVSLSDHYRAYGEDIDNRSFRLDARYLRDYRWHDLSTPGPLFLFASTPASPDGSPLKDAPLAAESLLSHIPVEKMPPPDENMQDYDYTIRSKTGFVRFSLAEPAMGFGERRYRALFQQLLMKRSTPPTPPIAPSIEHMTADYRASDKIDLRECRPRTDVGFWHIHPLGIRRAYPDRERRPVPLIASMAGDTHLIFGLSGVRGGEHLHLWFDFVETEYETVACPSVVWYWGDGYHWRELPHETIIHDDTENFSRAGMIGFDIPDLFDDALRDGHGVLWFRAAIVAGMGHVPALRRVVPNAMRLVMDGEATEGARVELLKPVPGIAGIHLLAAPGGGRSGETPPEKIARVSEFVTHRGRAVTARDYERLVLQAFPEISYAECFPGLDTKGSRRGVVTLVAIPSDRGEVRKEWLPLMTGPRLMCIEKYLADRAAAGVTRIDVVNPIYEQILIRGIGSYRPGYSTGYCRSRLKELCDSLIAPWQQPRLTPRPGTPLDYDTIAAAIRAQPCVASLDKLTIIRLSRHDGTHHAIEEFDSPGGTVHPTLPHAIFIPASEHLFPHDDKMAFGIGEMAIGDHFII